MITIPTISQLYSDVIQDIEAEFGDSIPVFGKVFLVALAGVQAAKLKLLYLAVGVLQKNVAPDSADPEAAGGTLERWGRIKLNRDPFPATAGEYVIQVTGTIGATIAALTTFKSNDDSTNPGKLFIVDTAHVLVAATDSVTVRALEAGDDSQMAAGEEMTATIPIAGVNRLAVVLSESVEPLAAEDIEDYRQDVLDSFRTEPQGGAAGDYRLWAADAQGVAKVYPYAKSGAANEINIFVEATIADSTDGKGTPSQAILDAVEDVVELDPDTTLPINERGRRPLGVFDIHFLAVTIKEIDITVADYVGLTATIEDDIYDALEEMISEMRPFIAGADVTSERNDSLSINNIIAKILETYPGAVFGSVSLYVDGVLQSGSYSFTEGNIAHFRTLDI